MENEMQKEENNEYPDNAFSSFGCERDAPSRERSPTTIPLSPRSKFGYIEHSVSKLDTLVGIAIKYGVEVADIKKMNGLITDHQMFALKTICIPLHGRHPPSPSLSSSCGTPGQGSSDHSPSDHAHHELFGSFQSLSRVKSSGQKVSPAMSSLQGYYGLKSTSNSVDYGSTKSNRTLAHHRKSRSLINVIFQEIMESSDEPANEDRESNSNKLSDKLFQRRQKSEADFTRIPELLLKEDTNNNIGLPSRTGKRIALRQKPFNRMLLANDSESSGSNHVVTSMGDAFLVVDASYGVRKSSSTPCLQDQDNSSSSSIWPTSMWNLKPDLQGFSKPTTGRRNKAALD